MVGDDSYNVMETIVGSHVLVDKVLFWYLLQHCMTAQQHLVKWRTGAVLKAASWFAMTGQKAQD